MMLLLLLLACARPAPERQVPYSLNGWLEIPAPRPDLQCWTRFHMEVVCAPSLTSTRGAGL